MMTIAFSAIEPSQAFVYLYMDDLIVIGCSEKYKINKEERYSRVPRLSNTRYSANETKGK